jgi:hypothetical protein
MSHPSNAPTHQAEWQGIFSDPMPDVKVIRVMEDPYSHYSVTGVDLLHAIIFRSPGQVFQVLTENPSACCGYWHFVDQRAKRARAAKLPRELTQIRGTESIRTKIGGLINPDISPSFLPLSLPNLWVGVTVSNNSHIVQRVAQLGSVPTENLFAEVRLHDKGMHTLDILGACSRLGWVSVKIKDVEALSWDNFRNLKAACDDAGIPMLTACGSVAYGLSLQNPSATYPWGHTNG